MKQTVKHNKAVYHKVCRNKYDTYKLQSQLSKINNRDINKSSKTETPTRSSFKSSDPTNFCLFCDLDGRNERVVQASKLGIGPTICIIAVHLGIEKLLAKLISTDLVAVEANFHKRCYVSFRTRGRSDERHSTKKRKTNEEGLLYGTFPAELAEYTQDLYIFSDTSPVLKLSQVTIFLKNNKALGFENYGL
ncbi:hypothetical protein AVEN_259593-1 [Araneus ventricosus]|uniref:Uncharacterized protein n=1 Tax=Araneus ventricosus TaxID=182803 RepID=A0A4Y2ERU4_ARAVE|nr:hypothetical protein AVEN_259593-1 [Araneus ventricosus]